MRYAVVLVVALVLGAGPAASQQEGHLQPGSDPSVLPGPILVADEDNDRIILVDPQGRVTWAFPEPGDLRAGDSFKTPDDAFYTPDGKQIIVTHEENFAVSLVDVASRRIVWRYGTPGVHGHGPNQLWNPDDAMVLPDGHVLIPDIKNCRILLIAQGTQAPERIYGAERRPRGGCRHDPPRIFGSPNGAFPMRNGHYLVTEIQGAWHGELDLKTGTMVRSFRVPGVRYPSDSNEFAAGRYVTADYSKPGQLVIFDGDGKVRWRYKPTGPDALDHPSLAIVLPNGMVAANDDANHRVIVVDPKTNRVVWQYGVTGKKGREPGLLNTPDGIDLAPPYSLLMQHAQPMGPP